MKKEKECNITQDLLLSYIDGVLTEDSKKFVEEHLKKCKECREKLDNMKKETEENINENEQESINYLKKVKKEFNKKNKYIIIIGIILAIVIILNIAVFINYNIVACEMEIFLSDDISEENLEKIKQIIKSYDNEAEIEYCSKQKALEDMKENFEGNLNLLNDFEKNNILPASYKVKSQLQYMKNIENDIINIPGVKKIANNVDSNPYELFFIMCYNVIGG